MDSNFFSLDIEGGLGKLRVCTFWCESFDKGKEVFICLVLNNKSFTGAFNEETLRNWANENSITFEEYLDCMKHTFTSKWGPKNDALSLENSELIWQRVFKDFQVTFGKFPLSLVENNDFLAVVVSSLLDKCQALEEEVNDLTSKNESILSSLFEMQENSDQMAKEKNEQEVTLYSKFLSVLNEKKEIISRLNLSMTE